MKIALPIPATAGASLWPMTTTDIVERIRAPQVLMTASVGQSHRPVVLRIRWIIAPAVVRPQRCNRQRRGRRGQPIRPIQHAPQRIAARRRGAVSLLFVDAHAAMAERATEEAVRPLQFAGCIDADGQGRPQNRWPNLTALVSR